MELHRNYYELLGVNKDATGDQIKAAYKELARIYHPDSNFYTEIIEDAILPEQYELFKAITEAYNVLSNPSSRVVYDESLPPDLADWESPSVRDTWEEETRPESAETFIFGSSVPRPSFFENLVTRDVRGINEIMREPSRRRTIFSISMWAPFLALICFVVLVTIFMSLPS